MVTWADHTPKSCYSSFSFKFPSLIVKFLTHWAPRVLMWLFPVPPCPESVSRGTLELDSPLHWGEFQTPHGSLHILTLQKYAQYLGGWLNPNVHILQGSLNLSWHSRVTHTNILTTCYTLQRTLMKDKKKMDWLRKMFCPEDILTLRIYHLNHNYIIVDTFLCWNYFLE